MIITLETLKAITKEINIKTAQSLSFWINEFFNQYGVNTPKRMAVFLAQAAHETGGFTSFRENMNYASSQRLMIVFPKYFPTLAIALKYTARPVSIGNRVYANKMGNGDEASGDGYKYRGGGIFQVTGRSAFSAISTHIYNDENVLINRPDDIILPMISVKSAFFFWQKNNLNILADIDDFKTITKRINGGLNGYQSRLEYWEKAKNVLSDK